MCIRDRHTESKDVQAYFEGGTSIFDDQTEHFGSKRIVLKEVNKHAYLNKDVKQPNTLLNGAITNSATTLTVDTTAGFPTTGTLLIGSEQMTYTGKTATTFTGVSRAANSTTAATALDDATVKLASFTEDVFSGFKDKLRNTNVTAAITASVPDVSAGTATINVGSTAGFPDTGTILVLSLIHI